MPASLYAAAQVHFVGGAINWASDTIKAAITTSTYTPDPLTHDFFNDVTNEVVGTGYTAGGATLAGKNTPAVVPANSWGTSRANSTAYVAGDVYRPATGNGYVYQCVTAGTSAAAPPTFTTIVGDDFTDGTAVFTNRGRAVIQLDANDPSWATSTITGRTVVIYKSTGSAATSPLIAFDTAAADVSSTAGTWTYQIANGGFALFFID